jgi:3-dehydroquinate dehydratase II
MSGERVVLVLDGPNLNLLGDREPEIYGRTTLDEIIDSLRTQASAAGLVVEHVQSNHEGELVDAVQGARKRCAAIIINAGAFTHYSWALHDALAAYEGYVVEVHISNPQARESWRHTSVITPVADGAVIGMGPLGYQLALQAIDEHLRSADAE